MREGSEAKGTSKCRRREVAARGTKAPAANVGGSKATRGGDHSVECDACWGVRAIHQSNRSNLRCRWCAPEDWSNTLRGHDPPGRLGRP